jgi:hypothetical protein
MILMMEETQHPWDQRGNQTDHRVEMFATGFPPKAAHESESFPLSGSGGCGSGRGSGGRAGVPGDGLRPVSPGRPPGLRPLARPGPCRLTGRTPSRTRNFKLAGELDLVFQAPAGRVMGQLSYSKAVQQTGQGPSAGCGPGRGRASADRDIRVVLYRDLGAGGTRPPPSALTPPSAGSEPGTQACLGPYLLLIEWLGGTGRGLAWKPTEPERRLRRLEPARDGTARGSVFRGTDG